MTLKELYIKNYKDKLSKNQLFIKKHEIAGVNHLLNAISDEDYTYNDYELIHGNILLSDLKSEKTRKQKISDGSFDIESILKHSISKDKYETAFIYKILEFYSQNVKSGCQASEFKKLLTYPPQTFREAVQIVWLYLLTDTVFASLNNISFDNIDLILNEYLLNDIKNARTTDTEVIHIAIDLSYKYKLYKAVEKENFINPSPEIQLFSNSCLLSDIVKNHIT